jgi:hypothetical protein
MFGSCTLSTMAHMSRAGPAAGTGFEMRQNATTRRASKELCSLATRWEDRGNDVVLVQAATDHLPFCTTYACRSRMGRGPETACPWHNLRHGRPRSAAAAGLRRCKLSGCRCQFRSEPNTSRRGRSCKREWG